MKANFTTYVKKNHKFLFYKFVKSKFLINILSLLGLFPYLFCKIQNKPYFGFYLMARQTWATRKPYMQGLVKKEILGSKNQEFKILEVGSYAGNSTTTWAEAIQGSGQKFKIVCVDR